jgi:hypothetical protein
MLPMTAADSSSHPKELCPVGIFELSNMLLNHLGGTVAASGAELKRLFAGLGHLEFGVLPA